MTRVRMSTKLHRYLTGGSRRRHHQTGTPIPRPTFPTVPQRVAVVSSLPRFDAEGVMRFLSAHEHAETDIAVDFRLPSGSVVTVLGVEIGETVWVIDYLAAGETTTQQMRKLAPRTNTLHIAKLRADAHPLPNYLVRRLAPTASAA